MEQTALTPDGAGTRPVPHAALACMGLMLLAAVVRALPLGTDPLWADELFSVYWSPLAPHFLLGIGAHLETNPPAYYLLLHYWMRAAGHTAWAARLPSLLCSVATLPVVYALGRQLIGHAAGLLAAAFFAIDPVAIFFAEEARPYALLGLLDALALLGLAHAWPRLRQADPPWTWLAVFVAAAAAGVWVHYTSLLFIAACFGALALNLALIRPLPIRAAAIWTAAAAVIGLGIAWPLLLATSLTASANIAWIDRLAPWSVRIFAMDLLSHPGTAYTAPMVAACLLLLIALIAGLWRWRPDRRQTGLLILIPALFCAALIAVSLVRPLLLPRVGAWLIIPLCLLLARAALLQPTPTRRGAAAAAIAGLLLADLAHARLTTAKEDWPTAAHLIATDPGCAGPVLFGAPYGLGLLYYQPGLAQRPFIAVLPDAARRHTAEFVLMQRVMHPQTLDDAELAPFLHSHPNTAIVTRAQFAKMATPALAPLLRQARNHHPLGGGLAVDCF